MDPLTAFRKQYFKLPDCKTGLAYTLGFLFLTKIYTDMKVRHHIFGRDGKGGPALEMHSRIDHHMMEYREARKKFYYHQRAAKFYMPIDHSFNDKASYKDLTNHDAHFNTFLDPKTVPKHHDPEGYYFTYLPPELFYKE